MKLPSKCRSAKLFSVIAAVTLVGPFLIAQPVQTFTVGDYGGGAWNNGVEVTGFGISAAIPLGSGNGDESVGETFSINNANALINSIQVPVFGSSLAQFQIGIAAWNSSGPVGSMLYLSSPMTGVNGWQTITVTPNNLTLNQNQQYVLIVTPNNFVASSSPYNTGMAYTPGYSGGEMYNLAGFELSVNDLFDNSWGNANADFAFLINYQAAPVPEPTAPALLCLGSLALWLRKSVTSRHGNIR
jgi:hypothetical protein